MLPPLPRCSSWAYSSLISPGRISLPRKGCRVGLHIVLFEACSAFTRVAAWTLARSPIRAPLSEGFRHFVSSMPAPVASGWSESPGGACTRWKAPPCHGAHPSQTFGPHHARPLAAVPTAVCVPATPASVLSGSNDFLRDVPDREPKRLLSRKRWLEMNPLQREHADLSRRAAWRGKTT